MPKTQNFSIDLLRLDGDTQSRIAINQDTVDEYAEVIIEAKPDWPFPPVDVFHNGSEYFVADGFHRAIAGHQAERGSIPFRIHKGTARDARIFGMTANDKHGMRMTRADKRACVEWLIDSGEKMTQQAIARSAGVSLRTVQVIVAEQKAQTAHSLPRKRDTSATQPAHSDDLGEDGRTEPDGTEPQEPTPTPPRSGTDKRGGAPPKKLDRGAYYQQWDHAIGPIVRMVDRIGHGVDEHNGATQRRVEKGLRDATAAMMEWMEVEK